MLTLALAVMLPAAGLICVNAYHLKSIERDKVLEKAIHRDFQLPLAPRAQGPHCAGRRDLRADYLGGAFFPEMLEALIAYKLGEEGGNRLRERFEPARSPSPWRRCTSTRSSVTGASG